MSRFIFVFLLSSTLAFPAAAEERWEKYWECANNVTSNVEQAEPSIWDGARLIVDALCVMVASDLANNLVQSRPYLQKQPPGEAFESALFVIRRETAINLYNQRVLRMGLRRY